MERIATRNGVLALACPLVLLVMLAVPTVSAQTRAPQDAKAAPATQINLNTATAEQLDRLPGVGPKTAAAILELRQKIGGFKRVEDLMNVRGIGEKTFIKLRPYITVTPAKTERPGGVQ